MEALARGGYTGLPGSPPAELAEPTTASQVAFRTITEQREGLPDKHVFFLTPDDNLEVIGREVLSDRERLQQLQRGRVAILSDSGDGPVLEVFSGLHIPTGAPKRVTVMGIPTDTGTTTSTSLTATVSHIDKQTTSHYIRMVAAVLEEMRKTS